MAKQEELRKKVAMRKSKLAADQAVAAYATELGVSVSTLDVNEADVSARASAMGTRAALGPRQWHDVTSCANDAARHGPRAPAHRAGCAHGRG